MKKKPFDSLTAKKIINDYAEKINLLSRENTGLKKQLEDCNISLKINKEILYSHIKSKKNVSEECESVISDLKKENERLNNKITWLFSEKTELAKKLYKLEDSLNDKITQENIKNENNKTEKFILENKLMEKESQIKNLKRQLERYSKINKGNNLENIPVREIYIGDPNTINTEINNELVMSRDIIKKYIYLMQSERQNALKLNYQIKSLQEKISSQKQNSSFIAPTPKFNNSNNPQLALLSELFNQNNNQNYGNIDNYNNLSLSSDSNDDKDNFDVSQKENKRTKTVERLSKIPRLNFKKVENKYKEPVQIKVIGYYEDNDNIESKDKNENSILNQRYKAQIEIYKKTIDKYKEKVANLRNQIRSLIDKNNLLTNTLKIYFNNPEKSLNLNNATQNTDNNDISMTPCVNDASGISTNSVIFKGGALENINKLSELNKIKKLNQINGIKNININIIKNDINNNIDENKSKNKNEDPFDNIVIKDIYNKKSIKETDKITTKESSNN